MQEQGGGGQPEDDPHCGGAQSKEADERVSGRAPVPDACILRPKGIIILFPILSILSYIHTSYKILPYQHDLQGDQASTVGGAINYVKELEQHLQTLEAKNHIKKSRSSPPSPPFASFFNSPQYSSNNNTKEVAADIEATMIDSHVNLKVRARRQPKQLLRILMGLQSLRLTTLHLNVTTGADQTALYSFSLKVYNYLGYKAQLLLFICHSVKCRYI